MVEVGDTVKGKYRLLRLIGEGGMGQVFEAHHEVLDTNVALKFLHPEIAEQDVLKQRFLQEARVSAAIKNPHIVRVLDADSFSEGAFLVMELLRGEPLSYLLERVRRLPLPTAIDHMLQTLDGVAAAHALGIVHRDLKPDNLFVVPEVHGPLIKILDFGIAKLRQSTEYKMTLTRPGSVMGTPEYMAPEQAYSADLADSRSDVYSLGVVLFEMLSGKRPVEGETPQVIAERILTGQALRLDTLCPSLPSGLINVVHSAMAADPDERWRDAAALKEALLPFVPKLVVAAGPQSATPSASPPFAAILKTPRVDGVRNRVVDPVAPTRREVNAGSSTEIQSASTPSVPPTVKTAIAEPGPPLAAMGRAAPVTIGMQQPSRAQALARPGTTKSVSSYWLRGAAVVAALAGAGAGTYAYFTYVELPQEPPRPVRRTQVAPTVSPAAQAAPLEVETDADDPADNDTPVRQPVSHRGEVGHLEPATRGAAAESSAPWWPSATPPFVPALGRSFEPVVIPIPQIPLPQLPSNFQLPPGFPQGIPGIFPISPAAGAKE